MPTAPNSLLAEVFLLIEHPRQRLEHWLEVLAGFDARHAPPISSVVTYYNDRSGEALLNLQYDAERFDAAARQYVVSVAVVAEVGMIQPNELSDDERERFVNARLARCALRLKSQPTVARALYELATKVATRSDRSIVTATLPAGTSLVMPPIPARRTPPVPPPLKGSIPSRTTLTTPVVARPPAPVLAPETRISGSHGAARHESDDDEDRITSPLDLVAFQAMAAGTRRPDRVRVQYLRGGRWLAARVGALGLKGVTLLTGVLPQLNEHIDVALSFAGNRAILRGVVVKVSTRRQITASGAAVFSLCFVLDEHSRPRLTALIAAARAANVTIKPAPPRASRRFPVEWNVTLSTAKGIVKGAVLDVSAGGMFVRPHVPMLLDATVRFSLMLEDGSTPIAGRAKVVRCVSEYEAEQSGLVAGFGLEIIGMSEPHRRCWLGLVTRTERRTEKRVLISAHPSRLVELRACLASVGYAVISGTDPAMLVELANSQTRVADAVFIDSGWLQNDVSMAIAQELLASRNVPCVRMEADVSRVRRALDRALDVL